MQESWPQFDEVLVNERPNLQTRYLSAAPFSHLVFDNLFPSERLKHVASAFEQKDGLQWRTMRSGLQTRQVSRPGTPLPAPVQSYFDLINSGPFTRFLSDVTGIADLIPDPALYGGGMHQVTQGGTFDVHVDFTQHPRTFLKNRLVVITYLNEGWAQEDGGELELWGLKPKGSVRRIAPLFGRTVIMGQSREAAHGHLQPVREGRMRRSVAAYFYTNDDLPLITNDLLPTIYVARKGQSLRQRTELLLRLVSPPFILGGVKDLSILTSRIIKRIRSSDRDSL